jgi:enoyl-[acyl-carrier protein] reductase II
MLVNLPRRTGAPTALTVSAGAVETMRLRAGGGRGYPPGEEFHVATPHRGTTMQLRNRITAMLGIEIPVIQAPMGWIARAQLAAAVSNAGGMGIIETSSGELDVIRAEIRRMRELTDRPFGVNIAQAFVRDTGIAQFVIDQGVRFVTTSAGSPERYTTELKAAGLTVFHVVPTLKAARKAVDAGVDGLVVEGAEGGGFKNTRDVSSMVLLPLIRSRVDVPIIAAGGFVDGRSMAAAFALGAEGVQLGTRMVSAAESPVHHNWKDAIVAAEETDTVFLNRFHGPALRALRTARTTRLERSMENTFNEFGDVQALYFGGEMEAAVPLAGQVAGRIDSVKPVAQILAEIREEFFAVLGHLSREYLD